jgi:hypothetical protein
MSKKPKRRYRSFPVLSLTNRCGRNPACLECSDDSLVYLFSNRSAYCCGARPADLRNMREK